MKKHDLVIATIKFCPGAKTYHGQREKMQFFSLHAKFIPGAIALIESPFYDCLLNTDYSMRDPSVPSATVHCIRKHFVFF